MPENLKFKMTSDKLIRMVADLVIVNTALCLALILRFLWLVVFERQGDASVLFFDFLYAFVNVAVVVSALSLLIFSLSGFYSYGRAYQSRYKSLVIVQAVSLSYLSFGALTYFTNKFLYLPRSAYIMAWVFTIVLIVSSRLWSVLIFRMKNNVSKTLLNEDIDRVLVIGGGGYIGSALLAKLLEQGYKVRLLDLLMYGTDPIKESLDHPNLEIEQADFRQIDKVVQAMRGVQAVIHLGAIVGDPACAYDEKLTVEINHVATKMIAEVAKGCGVRRFIFASTCSVYGAGSEILNEHSVLRPVSLYAESKIASEKVLLEMADQEFSPTMMRFGTIYGFSGRVRFDLVVNLLTAKALLDKKITVFGGDQWRPFVHVDDAALAVLLALKAPRVNVHNETFNVGSNGQNYTIDQIGELIKANTEGAEIVQIESDGDRRDYRVNFDKISRVLGFQPNWTVEKGIEQVKKAINEGNVENYQDPKYSNLKFMREGSSDLIHSFTEEWISRNGYEIPEKTNNFNC